MPDPIFEANDQLGFVQALPTQYKQEVRSIFGEVTIPLVISTLMSQACGRSRSLSLIAMKRFTTEINSSGEAHISIMEGRRALACVISQSQT